MTVNAEKASLLDRIEKRKSANNPTTVDSKPMTDKQNSINALIVMIICFVGYFATVAREPMFGDGLEFMAAAASGGVPHPTGYPLLMLLLGPFSGSYFSGAMLCAFFAMLTAGVLTILVGRLLSQSLSAYSPNIQNTVVIALGVTFGFSVALWTQAVIVEAYALNALLLATALTVIFAKGDGEPICWRQLSVVALVSSLGAGNHATIGCLVFVFGARFIQSFTSGHTKAKHLPVILACGLLPVIVLYGLLMMRASASPAINWGNPADLETLFWVIKGGDYGQTQFLIADARTNTAFTLSTYFPFMTLRTFDIINHLGTQSLGPIKAGTGSPLVVLGFIFGLGMLCSLGVGLAKLFTKNTLFAIGYILTFVSYSILLFTYNIVDIADYYLAFFILLLPAILMGLNSLLLFVTVKMEYTAPDRQVRVAFVFVAIALIGGLSNFSLASQSRKLSASPIVEKFEEATKENAIVITHGDTDTYALWYLQQVEKKRPDVLVVAANFMRNEWYQAMLPAKGSDPHGRYVEVSPGSFRDFTADDQYAMIKERIIEPNIDSVPISITDTDGLMIQFTQSEYFLYPAANFVETPEVYLQYIEQHFAPPPTSLLNIYQSEEDFREETNESSNKE